jgi:hypothetical protein
MDLFKVLFTNTKGDFFNSDKGKSQTAPTFYSLVNIPIVFHVLQNQDNGGIGQPTLTDLQRDHAIRQTNKLYNIYDKNTKTSAQFATFVNGGTIVHTDVINKDCYYLTESEFETIVTRAPEWEFKIHAVICETVETSAKSWYPQSYPVNHPKHSTMFVDYRAVACYDDENNFLCDLVNGQEVSQTRWWRNRSVVFAHELGHIFGLRHTYSSSCKDQVGDGVSDTPHMTFDIISSCPGLLPYDRDRDLFGKFSKKDENVGANEENCMETKNICGNTCASCCTAPDGNQRECPLYSETLPLEVVGEASTSYPDCCTDNQPIDSCPLLPGVDSLNNVMAYIPDWCAHEFTPGQLARMLAQTFAFKSYIYCNYSTHANSDKCTGIPCATAATSPYCTP